MGIVYCKYTANLHGYGYGALEIYSQGYVCRCSALQIYSQVHGYGYGALEIYSQLHGYGYGALEIYSQGYVYRGSALQIYSQVHGYGYGALEIYSQVHDYGQYYGAFQINFYSQVYTRHGRFNRTSSLSNTQYAVDVPCTTTRESQKN